MDRSGQNSWFLILFLIGRCFGTLGDITLSQDGAKVIWNNNSNTFSISASSSMSESVNYIWPVADGDSGQVIVTDGAGVFSFVDVNAVAGTHDILSITHDDAVGATVTAGDIIFGNSTPKWADLPIGASNEVLRVSGGLPDWQATTFITELGIITTGTWNATPIDISDYTNLTVTSPITLTDDDIGITILKDIVAGVGLSGGEDDVLPGADADTTLTFDATELDNLTWSDGANSSNTWVFDVSGIDPCMIFGNNLITFDCNVTITGILTPNDRGISSYGLVAYWPFDGDAEDYSGNSNDGTITGANTVDAKFGAGLDFDANVPTVVVITDNNSLDVNNITVAAWIRTTSTNEDIVRKWESSGNQRSWTLNLDSSRRPVFSITTDGTTGTIGSGIGSVLVNGQWHHLVGTHDGTTVKIYVDGVLDDTDTEIGTVFKSTSNIKFADNFIRTNNFNGQMDEIMIYDRVIDGNEVKSLYEKNKEHSGRKWPAFGSFKGNEINWTQAAAQNTWYTISDSDISAGQTRLTTFQNNQEILISQDGIYSASYYISLESSIAGKHVLSSFEINGTEQADGQNHHEFSAANTEESWPGVGLLNLLSGDVVSVGVATSDAGNPTLTVNHIGLVLIQESKN